MTKKRVLSIQKAVDEILSEKPFIEDIFRIDAINYSGLARHLIPELKEKLVAKKINHESIIVAIRRHAEKINKRKGGTKKVLKNLAKCDLRLKGNIVDFTLKRNFHNYETVLETYKKIKWDEGDVIYVYQSLTEIAVILNEKNSDLIIGKVPKGEIINNEENLAMLTIKTPSEIIRISGFFYYILGLIAKNGISLIDIISTYTELVLIVKEEDGAKAYDALMKRIKEHKKKGDK